MLRVKILTTRDDRFEQKFQKLLNRSERVKRRVSREVAAIIEAVREKGDEALFAFTARYDGITVDKHTVEVREEEIVNAYHGLTVEQREVMECATKRIERFHQQQKGKRTAEVLLDRGERIGEVIRPLQKVGLYIPGGKASYPSSVLMSAIPARIAGVREIIMVSPHPSTLVLAAARVAGVDRVFRVGGAQAVAALAYGTESIPQVDKVVGPGNKYVEAAKRMVFGQVGLDMVAGPSEILIIADESSVPAFIAADLLAQAEHDEDASAMLITLNRSLLKRVRQEMQSQFLGLKRRGIVEQSLRAHCTMIVVKDMEEAVNLAEQIAPEHLSLMVKNAEEVEQQISRAGAVFLGNYSPVTVGDYLAGPSHILPTAGSARFFSPLGVDDFTRRMSVISFNREAFQKVSDTSRSFALMEGLDAHAQAVTVREAYRFPS